MKSSWRGPNYTTEKESNKGAPRVRTAPRGEAIPLGAPLPQRDKKIPGAAVLDLSLIHIFLKQTDLNTMSPIEALNKLYQLKALVQ